MKRLRLGVALCMLGLLLGLVPVFMIDELKCCYFEWKYDCHRIRPGMTLAEVERILGPGSPDHPWLGADGWYTWHQKEIEISVCFEAGRVSRKSIYAPFCNSVHAPFLEPSLRE